MIPLPLIETNSMTILQHNNNARMNNKRSLPLDNDAPISRKRPRTQHRRVRFHDASNVSYPTTITKEDCRSLWYAQQDYDEFRRSTTSHLRNAWQAELMTTAPPQQSPSFSSVVQTVYNQCTATTKSDPVMVLSPHDTKQLQTLFVDDTRLEHVGLERVLARSVGKDRVMRRKRLALLVRQVQQKLNDNNEKNDAFKSWANRSKEDILRGVCEEVSRTSRLFAQCLAYASLQCEDCC